MKHVLVILLAACFWNTALAAERDFEASIGGGAGTISAAPWSSDIFSKTVTTKFREGAFARFYMAYPNPFWELSYDHFQFGKSEFSAHAAMLSLGWRFQGNLRFHPIFAIGGGVAFTDHFYAYGKKQLSVYRIRAGLEYELAPQFDVAAYLDHFSVFQNGPRPAEADAHALAPMIAAIYYFRPSK